MRNRKIWLLLVTGILGWFWGCASPKKEASLLDEPLTYDYRQAIQDFQIGCNYINNQDPGSALVHLKKALAHDPENFRYLHWTGLAYSMSGQTEQAISHLEKSLTVNPDYSESHNLLATIYTDIGRYPEAEQHLRKVLADKDYAQPDFAYFNLGLLMQAQDRLEEAVAAYNQATQLNGKFYRAYVIMGNLYMDDENYKAASYYFAKALEGYSNDPELLFNLGKAHFKLQQFQQAKRYLSQVSILFPPPELEQSTRNMLKYINQNTDF
jgi:Tfp pilus assembly protein PilF